MVERRSPNRRLWVRVLRSCQTDLDMKNPLRFLQEVKQETFRITWPTKETMMGAIMVFALASIAAIFSNFGPNTEIFIKFNFNN